MPNTILFVDEEPLALKAIQRAFRKRPLDLDIVLAGNPVEGMAALDRQGANILVTEAVFNGHNGLDFLNQVRDHHPQTARIILSGYVDRDVLLKSSDLAHQFLAKPFEMNELTFAISRAFMMMRLLNHEPLKNSVARIDTLPSLPAVYQQLVAALKSEDTSFEEIGQIIARDMGMSAKLLKVVNSPFFGLPRQVSSPAQAVSLLGLDLVGAMVLVSGSFDHFKTLKIKGFSLDRMWDHAMTVAVMAKTIAQEAGMSSETADAAFMAGLLHDLGKLLVAAYLTDTFRAVLDHMRSHDSTMAVAEEALLGTTHAPIGAYLLGLWGLPDTIMEAAAYHHRPGLKSPQNLNTTALVHIADAFANALPDLADSSRDLPGLDHAFLEATGLSSSIPAWCARCAELGRASI